MTKILPIPASIKAVLNEIATFGTDEGSPLCEVEATETTYGIGELGDDQTEIEVLQSWEVTYDDNCQCCEDEESALEAARECLDKHKSTPQWVIDMCRKQNINPLYIIHDPREIAYLDHLEGKKKL
jgi:hypothetical protein